MLPNANEMIAWTLIETTLPFTNPVLKFLLILLIILCTPLLLNKIRIPALLGLILAGAVIGPHGFNLMERDSGIILSGTAGLLYIMFLAGLEIDLAEFKKNRQKSLVFGLYTFGIPMILGFIAGFYLLKFSVSTSLLLASMFASHTLIAYPLISKLGVAKNRAVNITVGGTLITDTLALLVLAVIVGMHTGEVNAAFWIKLSISIVLFGLTVIFIFPILGRWFFKRFNDNISHYIFVLMMVFLGAFLAEIAGIEAIIGAFFTGLALNRLILRTSPLMNRIEFVGNAIFIPFFLIGVGMLVDFRVFFKDWETIKIASVMILVATLAKYVAAWLTQKTFRLSKDERRLIFGLSNAQAAATLAAVMIGYNLIVGETATGEPIRLLNEGVLNGTILMILFTCTIASFIAQKGAKNIALSEHSNSVTHDDTYEEKILIPINNSNTIDALINLGIMAKSKPNKNGLFALSIVDDYEKGSFTEKNARKILDHAVMTASATDNTLHALLRYDLNIVNGIAGVAKEHTITDLILGLHIKKNLSHSFLGSLTEGILSKCSQTTFIYKPSQPLSTINRHVIIVPEHAEKELGFPFWLKKVWNIAQNSNAKLVFFGTGETKKSIDASATKHQIAFQFKEFTDWDDFLVLKKDLLTNDNLIIVLSRKNMPSYHHNMNKIAVYLNSYFNRMSYILVYPMQPEAKDDTKIDMTNPTLLEPIDEIGQSISKIFKRTTPKN